MKICWHRDRGFTLIELLVVISIIGLLSSVVMASLNGARLKAKDAAIRQEMLQLRMLYEQSYLDKGDYFDWQFTNVNSGDCSAHGTVPNFNYYCTSSATSCAQMFQGAINTPNTEAVKLCSAIASLNGGGSINGKAAFVMGVAYNLPGGTKNYYSIAAYLPSKQTYFCVGKSGISDTAQSTSHGILISYDSSAPLGCFLNP